MKLNKLIYDIREALNQSSDDSSISDRYIAYLWGIKRNGYLSQAVGNFNKEVKASNYQKFCLELEEVSTNQCGLDLECSTILRSKVKIPRAIGKISVTPTNILQTPFNVVDVSRLYHIDGSLFTSSLYAFHHLDDYIYVYSKGDSYKFIDCITINGIFEDPLELSKYKQCCGCDETTNACYDEDTSEYPLQGDLIRPIRQEILQDLLGKETFPEDQVNDGEDANIVNRK